VILLDEYFEDSIANWRYTRTPADFQNADDLLTRVNALEEEWIAEGGSPFLLSSGHRTRQRSLDLIARGYRAALGGKHETSQAVDILDGDGVRDDWISSFDRDGGANNSLLERFGLWREDAVSTPGWCHLQNVPPKSGRRTFQP